MHGRDPRRRKERESERIWEKNMAEENDKLLCEYENMGKKEWENEKCEQVIKQNKTRKKTNKEQRTKKDVPFGVVV